MAELMLTQPDNTESFMKLPEEIPDICKDTKTQLNDISSELANVIQKIAEAKTQI